MPWSAQLLFLFVGAFFATRLAADFFTTFLVAAFFFAFF